MRNFLLFLFCVYILSVFAVEVSGSQSGEWTSENNPYEVVGDITIPEGEELYVQSDVQVVITGNFHITVEGKLMASGTMNLPVLINAENNGVQWAGIRLENEFEESVFEQCYIQNAETGINSINSPVTISDCYFNDNEQAIHVFGIGNSNPPEVLISGCSIENCLQNGIYIVENSNTIVSNCNITSCALDGSPRGAIMLSSQGGECSPIIRNNEIHDNVWQGISAWDITGQGNNIAPLIQNNEIHHNLTGIYLYFASGELRDNHIHDNYVTGNANSGAGIMLQGGGTNPVCTGNEIHHNFCAVYITQDATANFGCVENYWVGDDGENHFYENTDETWNTWSIYNTSSYSILAQNNTWDSDIYSEIDATIFDGNDNAAYGIVDYDPIYSETVINQDVISSPLSATNFPNPFNPETTISFSLPKNCQNAKISIFNSEGQKIQVFHVQKQTEIVWDGTDFQSKSVSSGVYFYQVKANQYSITKKMILLQ